jgi:hypothetical protein
MIVSYVHKSLINPGCRMKLTGYHLWSLDMYLSWLHLFSTSWASWHDVLSTASFWSQGHSILASDNFHHILKKQIFNNVSATATPFSFLFSKSKWYFPLSGIWQNRGNLQIGTSKSFNKNYDHAQRPDVLHTRVAFLHPFIHEQVDILTLLSAITHTNALNFSSVVAPTWSALGVMCPWEQTIPTK